MNKKLNTLLFFVGATAVNVLLVLILAIGLFVPYALFLAPVVPAEVNIIALILVVVGAMAGSFPIYRWLINLFQQKVDMDKYFDPIVKSSQKGRK